MKTLNWRPWQPPLIDFGVEHKRCNLLARMGMGKTPAVLEIHDRLRLLGEVGKHLVTAPLRVARSTWPEEPVKWHEFAHLKVQPITGTKDQRIAALRNDKADIYTINYENLPWLVEHLGDAWPFDTVTADEASKLRSFRLLQGGKRAQALASVAHTKVRRWINLSGTIAPNGLSNLWAPMWFIDRGQRLGRSYDSFESRWFGYKRAKDAVNAHKTRISRIAFPHAFGEITGLMRDVTLALNPKDWFPIKDPIVVPVYVDLPPEARKKYREMERDMLTHINGHDIEAFAASGKVIKCIAEDTEVLTDEGWLPIQCVTRKHRVWDGDQWVSTDGCVCNGYMPVLECFGVRMTADHKVLTVSGWAEAQEVLNGQSSGRYARKAVRLPDSYRQTRFDPPTWRKLGRSYLAVPMPLRERSGALGNLFARQEPQPVEVVWLPFGRDDGRFPRVARHDRASGLAGVECGSSAVHEPAKQRLAQLRRAWHSSLQAVAQLFHRFLGRHGSDMGRRVDARSEERQQALFTQELSVGDGERAIKQHPFQRQHQDPAWRHDGCAGSRSVRREVRNSARATETGLADQQGACAAKVYDIVNAGPRQRFVVRGRDGGLLIVHNCQQLANGAVYTGSDEQIERDVSHWVEAHEEKLDALESITEENDGEPILVAYHFKPDLARLKKRFPHGRHINTKADEDAFKRGEIELAFVHPQSIGHGVDGFQNVCHIIVFFALSYDLDPHDQIIERIGPMRQMQAGFDREVLVYQIIARDTIDEIVAERLVEKRGVLDATMDALALKPKDIV